jgi:hypothetical protein
MGVRILSPKTVTFMSANHLNKNISNGSLYLPGPGYGFGLGICNKARGRPISMAGINRGVFLGRIRRYLLLDRSNRIISRIFYVSRSV